MIHLSLTQRCTWSTTQWVTCDVTVWCKPMGDSALGFFQDSLRQIKLDGAALTTCWETEATYVQHWIITPQQITVSLQKGRLHTSGTCTAHHLSIQDQLVHVRLPIDGEHSSFPSCWEPPTYCICRHTMLYHSYIQAAYFLFGCLYYEVRRHYVNIAHSNSTAYTHYSPI